MTIGRLFLLLVATVLAAGCAAPAPLYQSSFDNTLVLKRVSGKAKVGEFTVPEDQRAAINKISLRADSMTSPYNDSYAEYLREALKQELREAGRLDENADLEVNGVLLKNSVDAWDFKVGTARLSARFVVRKGTAVRYDNIVSVDHQWPSSFPAMIAVPTARDNYPLAVQKLIKQLLADPRFTAVLK
jgi:hypothetical protein